MRVRRVVSFATLLAGAVTVFGFTNPSGVSAQALTWDSSGNGTVLHGSGTWDSAGNCYNGPPVGWSDSSDAVFGASNGTAGTVTINNIVQPNSITFNPATSGNYLITDGSIDIGPSGTSMSITVNADATIASQVI